MAGENKPSYLGSGLLPVKPTGKVARKRRKEANKAPEDGAAVEELFPHWDPGMKGHSPGDVGSWSSLQSS